MKKEAAAGGGPAPRGRLLPVAELGADDYARLFRRCAWYVLAGAVAFAVVFALLAWLRYRAYYGGRFDLGNMVQAVYNTAHGRFLEITTAGPQPRQMSRLGAHVDPILAAFALPWLVWPSPVMLLTLQSAIVATSAWPAYRLGARVTRDPRAGALLAGALLLYPALGYGVLNEFHPVTLATPFLLFAFLYIEEDRWLPAVPFLVLGGALQGGGPARPRRHGGLFRPAQALVAAARPDGARDGVLRVRDLGRDPALQRRAESLRRPVLGLRGGRRRSGRQRRDQPRSGRRRPARAHEPRVLGRAALALRLRPDAEPADASHRRAGVPAERPVDADLAAQHPVPLHGGRDPLHLRRPRPRPDASLALAERRLSPARGRDARRAAAAPRPRPARLPRRARRQLRPWSPPLLPARGPLLRQELRAIGTREGARRGRGDDPRRRCGVGEQQRRLAPVGATRRLRLS